MDEIVFALNKIADLMSDNGTPLWLTAVGIVMPIMLTGITIFISFRTDMQNKELQKQMHNRDSVNQIRQAVMEIYQAFFDAFVITEQGKNNVADIFISNQSYYQWCNTIETALKEISLAHNKLKLLLPEDKELVSYIKVCWMAFADINNAINAYLQTGIAAQTINMAWATFQSKYGAQPGDYMILYQNPALGEEFKKLCENAYTQNIRRKLEAYSVLIGASTFDKVFEKYVQFKELE